MQSHAPPTVRCQCDAVVLLKLDFVCFLPFILIMQSHAPTRVRCQCDAVVLIKIGFLCFSFPFILIMQSHAPYTGKM
jgi:hypothetical protein